MALSKPSDGIVFADSSLEKAYNELAENSPLKKSIKRVMNKLKANIFCGENISKDRIPKEYIQKYKIENLWWCPLSDAWRLVYSVVSPSNFEILAVIIEYFNHKNYERRFGY